MDMKTPLQEWIFKGQLCPYCPHCVHFLVPTEPRIVKQAVIYPSDSPITVQTKFVDTCKSTPVCNDCFYHADGTPSNFAKRGEL